MVMMCAGAYDEQRRRMSFTFLIEQLERLWEADVMKSVTQW